MRSSRESRLSPSGTATVRDAVKVQTTANGVLVVRAILVTTPSASTNQGSLSRMIISPPRCWIVPMPKLPRRSTSPSVVSPSYPPAISASRVPAWMARCSSTGL